MRVNERTDVRVAQYLRLYSCLFHTTVQPSLVDLVQMHMAAGDIFGAVVTSLLQYVTRVVLMYDGVEGVRLFSIFCLLHIFTMSFEDISTILISAIRFKQVTKLLFFSRENSFFP